MIDESKLMKKLKKNSIFETITNVEGKNIYEMIEESKVNEWVLVEERLPDIPTPNDYFDNKHIELYLVDIGDRYPLRAIRNGKIFTDGFHELDVIKWMPLPKLYRKDEK